MRKRISKILINSQLHDKNRNIGRLYSHVPVQAKKKKKKKKKTKTQTLSSLYTFKKVASLCKDWKAKCHKAIKKFEKTHLHYLRILGESKKFDQSCQLLHLHCL